MKFLIDRCAGRRLADWLRENSYDVLHVGELGPDPGDLELLKIAFEQERVLITIDNDFGDLIFLERLPHHGLIRLPDVPSRQRIALMREVLERHREVVEEGCIITIKGDRLRITRSEKRGGGTF